MTKRELEGMIRDILDDRAVRLESNPADREAALVKLLAERVHHLYLDAETEVYDAGYRDGYNEGESTGYSNGYDAGRFRYRA